MSTISESENKNNQEQKFEEERKDFQSQFLNRTSVIINGKNWNHNIQ